MTIQTKKQEELDVLIRRVKKNANWNFGVFTFINGRKTPNYTNHIELIEHDGQRYLVKTSKIFSNLFNYAKAVVDFIKIGEFRFIRGSQRQLHESDALDELFNLGVCVPERIVTPVKGVLVLKYFDAEEMKFVLRDSSRYKETVVHLTKELSKIHQVGLHGEPSTNNSFVSNGRVYWVDFERYSKDLSEVGLVRELVSFIKSVSKHSHKQLDSVASVVFDNYPNVRIVELAKKDILCLKSAKS